jgi:hypothetical protein
MQAWRDRLSRIAAGLRAWVAEICKSTRQIMEELVASYRAKRPVGLTPKVRQPRKSAPSPIAPRKPTMSDRLLLEQGKAIITTEEGRSLERTEDQLVDMLRKEILPPLNGTAIPDGIKFMEWRAPFMLVVHQLPPHVRQFRWIANDSPQQYGPGTTYRKVRLSIPYSITFALYFERGGKLYLAGSNELYFRNEPLRSKSEKLCYPALLNISRINTPKRQRSWICTQYLRHPKGGDWTSQLSALLDHTWNGGFNRSSEHHEGASWYGESKGVHADLHPVERWEAATTKDEAFALRVPWKPAALTVTDLMDCMFEECKQGVFSSAFMLAPPKKPAGLVSRFINFKP